MKKFISLILVVMMLSCCMTAVAQDFSATAAGFCGDVTVTLTIDSDKLTAAKVEGAGETPAIGGAAMEKLAAAMVEGNRVDVDAVTGATVTSNAVLKAAAEALTVSGVALVANEVSAEAVIRDEETTDVLVIGGGGAGLAAAISATEAGAKTILVEKLSFLGGCSAMSGGVITRGAVESDGPGNMNADELYDFLMETSEQRADADIVRKYADMSVDTYNWIYDNMVKHPETVTRYAMVPETLVSPKLPGGGSEIIGDMADYAAKVGVEIRLEASAVELIQEEGKVIGAVISYADGSTQKVFAKGGVVLATGGFASSAEKLAQYSTPGADKIASYASAGTVGDGLDMAEAVGAKIHFNDDWDTCGTHSMRFTGYDSGKQHYPMLINANGERFVNEVNIPPTIYVAMRRNISSGVPNSFWFVLDENTDPDTQWLIDRAGAVIAHNIEELAEITGAPIENLKATIEDYNAAAGTNNDVFGKPAEYNKGLTAPYTVVHAEALRVTTIGGLSITTDAEVIAADGGVIPGLYAAGELANSNFYGTIYTCGTAFGHAVVYGQVAGASAAANLK